MERVMSVLPDILAPNLDVVFCGTAVGKASASRGHYYSGPGNKCWQLLHVAGFTATRLRPEDDVTLPALGLGITDLVKDVAQSHDRGLDFSKTRFAAHIEEANPRWIAFNGLTSGRAAARRLGHRATGLGPQPWHIGQSQVYVLPSSSAANATMRYNEKLKWWANLAHLAK
jgi:TDG/mug DNA glycosylase family protein